MIDFINNVATLWSSISWVGLVFLLLIAVVVLALFAAIIWFATYLVSYAFVDERKKSVKVTNKYYSSARSSMGIGVTNGPNGVAPVVTSDSSDEIFTVEVEFLDRKRTRIDVSQKCFDRCDVGDNIIVGYKVPRWIKGFKIVDVYPVQVG